MSANKTSAPLFSNLGKAPKDLLSKGFPTTNKVEVTTTAENGVNFVATAEKRQVDKAEAIVTTLQPKYHLNVYGIELNGTLDTNNQIKAELNIEDLLVPGLKTISKAQTGANQDLEVAFEYKHEKGTFTSSFLHNPSSSKTLISATATVSQQKITAGAETKYSLAPSAGGSLTSFTGALNYKAGAHDFTAYLYDLSSPSRLFALNAATADLDISKLILFISPPQEERCCNQFVEALHGGCAFALLAQQGELIRLVAGVRPSEQQHQGHNRRIT